LISEQKVEVCDATIAQYNAAAGNTIFKLQAKN